MEPVSAELAAVFAKSHTRALKIEVVSATGSVLGVIADQSSTAATATKSVVVTGSVTVEKRSNIRRRCELDIVDPDGTWVPTDSGSLLTPYGNQIRIYMGAYVTPTTTELIQVGTFRISRVAVTDSGDNFIISISGYDRSRAVSRNAFAEPYSIAASTNFGTAIRDLIINRLPEATFANDFTTVTTSDPTTPALEFPESHDPWDAVSRLAQSVACDCFVNRGSSFALVKDPVLSGTTLPDPSITFDDTSATPLAPRFTRTLDDEDTFNTVIVTGEVVGGAAIRAKAIDGTGTTTSSTYYTNDATSPSSVDSAFGTVTRFERVDEISSTAQALTAAKTVLTRSLGLTEAVSIDAIPQPHLDVDDVAELRRVRVGIGTDDDVLLGVVDSYTLPLHPGLMSITFRARRTYA